MKFHGHINLLNNEMQQMVLQAETNFPTSPTAGRIIFKEKRVYICAEIAAGVPVWIPLTNEIDTYLHNQPTASASWNIVHNLNTGTPLVQIYDTSNLLVTPDNIEVISNNQVTVTLGTAVAGRAVVMFGAISGSEKQTYVYEHFQTTLASSWVVPHNLGYYPIVRVFVGGAEIQPVSIVHNSVFQTTITFSGPLTGYARFV